MTNIDHLIDETQPESVTEINEARLSEEALHVEDDMGSATTIRTIYAGTCLALRRMVRELSPGGIPTYSPYDCTGKLIYQKAKFLKVYRNYARDWVGVIEIRKAYDV